MSGFAPSPKGVQAAAPWYMHRWPWLLMLGPFVVVVAGAFTMWLAVSRPDALVMDDYYKEGKAINQDLRRDRTAAGMKLQANLRYDPASGKLAGNVHSFGQPLQGKIHLTLAHSTLPEKDVSLDAVVDEKGDFSVALPMLDTARWQVQIENDRHDWRLHGEWAWPQEAGIALNAEALPN